MTRSHRVLVAILVSAAAHAFIGYGTWLQPAESPRDLQPLQARLESPPVPAAALPDPVSEAVARSVVARLPRRQDARDAVVSAADAGAAPQPAAMPNPVPDSPAPVERVEPVILATAPESTLAAELPPPRALPRRGHITFHLYYGDDRTEVGRVVQTWQADGGAYTLESDARTVGLIEAFRPQRWRYTSRGRITARGLQPDAFTMNRTRRGRDEATQARFDWAGASLALGSPQATRAEPLRAGSQDLISMMFQLALVPPAPGRFSMPVTNGSRFEEYDLQVLPEESLDTPLGLLRVLPVRQVRRPGQDGLEIWLATEYRHLPVRIRFVGRDGETTGEQVASEIRVSDQ